ncbi:hypothetical protein A5784_03845 [Mycobacterium sp. 852013-50091_SCH5140682]|nr:hypothetical protein [Mycobacterium sp. 852013-50091_SCH5140682]OBC11959.1 hypothetical protein A5784_03845 [Mycobacterium sp. 852013-50091_SCH5140682]
MEIDDLPVDWLTTCLRVDREGMGQIPDRLCSVAHPHRAEVGQWIAQAAEFDVHQRGNASLGVQELPSVEMDPRHHVPVKRNVSVQPADDEFDGRIRTRFDFAIPLLGQPESHVPDVLWCCRFGQADRLESAGSYSMGTSEPLDVVGDHCAANPLIVTFVETVPPVDRRHEYRLGFLAERQGSGHGDPFVVQYPHDVVLAPQRERAGPGH